MIARPAHALRRLRLEIDRTIRARAFFGRLLQSGLSGAEYADLLGQLVALLDATETRFEGTSPRALARADLLSVGEESALAFDRPCTAVELFGTIAAGDRPLAPEIAIATLGTSWVRDAQEVVGHAHVHGTSLLGAVARAGPISIARLESALESDRNICDSVLGLAELTRGAVLGVAAYLDQCWPAPVLVLGLGIGGGVGT